KFVEAHRAFPEMPHNQNRPFVAHQTENLVNRSARIILSHEMGGAVEVTRFQKGASLHEMISIQYSVGIYLLPRNWKDNQMAELKIGIVVGSTREGRFADKPANWIRDLAQQRPELDVELVDLRDYPMPFFEDATSPA